MTTTIIGLRKLALVAIFAVSGFWLLYAPTSQAATRRLAQDFGDEDMSFSEDGSFEDESDARRLQEEKMQVQGMKRMVPEIERGLKQFDSARQMLKKKGIDVPEEILTQYNRVKEILAAVKKATTLDELLEAGVEELEGLMNELGDFQRDFVEKQMRLDGLKKGVKSMEKGIAFFEKQLATLTKQKIAVPETVTEALAKVKKIIAVVKAAKTWEEMEEAGVEQIEEIFGTLDEQRQVLEVLARWPQVLKEVDGQLKKLTAEVKRAKGIVDRLAKKDVDVSDAYEEFKAGVDKLKAARDKAVKLMQSGDSQEAFETLESEFFEQLESVWGPFQTIMTLNDLGRFASELKKGLAEAQQDIKTLKKKKIDVSGLEALLAKAKIQGNDVLKLIKTKPIDLEAVFEGMQELEGIRHEFEELSSELGGEEFDEDDDEPMPWERGPQIFKQQFELPSEFRGLSGGNEGAG